MKMDQRECSEKSAYKIQTLGNYPEESIQKTEYFGNPVQCTPKAKTKELTAIARSVAVHT